MAYFTDFLNQMFTPSEGREWKYEMAPEPDRYSDEWYDSTPGGTPTYYIGPSRGETLTSAPPSVYNRPAQGDVVPQPQAVVDVSEPNPLYALAPLAAAVPAAEAMRRQRGRNQAAADKKAQQARVREAKANRAASQLRGAASPAASAADYADARYGGRGGMPVTRGGMPVPMGSTPLEGEFIPRNASPARVTPRPGLPRPPIEGTVVRRGPGMMTKGGTALSLVGLPFLASAYEGEGASPQQAYGTALAETLLGLAVGPSDYLGGGMDVPMYGDAVAPGFGFVPPQRPMLSDLLYPQSFDTVNDILINQYLEGIPPYADVVYYR